MNDLWKYKSKKRVKFKGILYHYLQINFAYNSNESTLTEEIFATNSFIPKSEDIIVNMNKILKRNTSDEENLRYNVGGFKITPNKIGLINVIETSSPKNVEKDLENFLCEYHSLKKVTL